MRLAGALMLVLGAAGCSPPAPPAVEPSTPAEAADREAAAQVVRTYYALVESGRAAEAARLRRDGQVFDVTPFDRLNAQVRTGRRVEEAAGSLYVDVPVVLVGRYDTGAEYRASGRVTLRRSSDAPWRIEKIAVTTGY